MAVLDVCTVWHPKSLFIESTTWAQGCIVTLRHKTEPQSSEDEFQSQQLSKIKQHSLFITLKLMPNYLK